LCEKTDGLRCLLFCTYGNNNEEVFYLIDRRNDYYYLDPGMLGNLHLPHHEDPELRKYHNNTILDGELVYDTLPDGTRKLRYLVFDLLVLDGEVLTGKPYSSRLGRLQQWVFQPLEKFKRRHPAEAALAPFELRFKETWRPYGLAEAFLDKLPNLPHGNDGLIFTCVGTPYVTGTDPHILKWKPPHENSIDFRLHLGQFPTFIDEVTGETCDDYDAKPALSLEVFYGGKDYQDFAALDVTDEEWEFMKHAAIRDHKPLDGRIIECYRDGPTGKWRFKAERDGTPRFRDDKQTANHISTVNSVLQSIQDAVSQEDLITSASAIMRAWKRRHPEEQARAMAVARQPQPQHRASVPMGPPNGHP
jgi:mRNA guanylyltransferase